MTSAIVKRFKFQNPQLSQEAHVAFNGVIGVSSAAGNKPGSLDSVGKTQSPAIEIKSPHGKSGPAISTNAHKFVAAPTNMVTVIPSGKVDMGFNCGRKFEAKALSGSFGARGWWTLQFSQTGNPTAAGGWIDSQFIGGDSVNAALESWISFDIDASSYSAEELAGFRFFRIMWTEPTISGPAYWWSDPVELVFNSPPCAQINGVRFVVNGSDAEEYTCKGSKNGQEPIFKVYLSAPAQPGGQRVRIRSSNTNLGWIMNAPFYDLVIPAGQTSGSIGWFLGTKNVTTKRSFHLEANLVFPGVDGAESSAKALGKVILNC